MILLRILQQFRLMVKINFMKSCIVYGAGTYGQVYASYLKDNYNVLGFLDDNCELTGTTVDSLPVLGNLSFLEKHTNKDIAIFVPIGSNPIRVKILNKVRDLGYKTPSFIHNDTQIHDSVVVGQAVYILPSTSIMPFSKIGNDTMISMGVNIAHHVFIDNGCFFSQGVNVGASMEIQKQAYIGIGATIMTGVKVVGANCLVGAGSVVIRDIPSYEKVVGNPARTIG